MLEKNFKWGDRDVAYKDNNFHRVYSEHASKDKNIKPYLTENSMTFVIKNHSR